MYVYILGLDHSRTTIIDLVLGQKLGGVSLGEVRRTAFPVGGEADNLGDCSCGAAFEDCAFWCELSDDFEAGMKQAMQSGRVFIDSSKDIKHYRKFVRRFAPHLTIITYRGFDDWYQSVMAAGARENSLTLRAVFRDRKFILSGLRLYLRRFKWLARLEWAMTYMRFLNALVGPTVLVTGNDDVEALVAQYGGAHGAGEKHIVRGNRVRLQDDVKLLDFDESDGFSAFLQKRIDKRVSAATA